MSYRSRGAVVSLHYSVVVTSVATIISFTTKLVVYWFRVSLESLWAVYFRAFNIFTPLAMIEKYTLKTGLFLMLSSTSFKLHYSFYYRTL